MTPIQAVNSPQISVLKKESPQQLGASVMKLLLELTQFAPCAWNDKTIAPIAKMLIDTFWGLRFDEFIYVFRKGINGGYPDQSGETKVFGALQYADLARWLNEYSGNERAEAEAFLRNQNKPKEVETPVNPELKKQTDEMIASLSKKFELKAQVENNDHNRPAITHESIDRKTAQLLYQLNYDGRLSDIDVIRFKSDAELNNWHETIKFCRVNILAKKIIKGETDFSAEELQTQQNYPKELELELKQLSDEAKENAAAENDRTEERG